MPPLPEVKLKAKVNWPILATGGTAVTVNRNGGTFTVDLDYDKIQITPTVPAQDMPNSYNLIWDQVKKTFAKVPFALQATSGVSSLASQTGAISIDSSLQMVGSTLKVTPSSYVSSIDSKTGAVTLDSSLKTTSNVLAVNTVNLTGGVSTVTYTQTESGAVSSPMIRRLNNTLFASEFGAVGDDATNDYTALQAFINAVASSGKEGRFDPGKKYYVSEADLTITNGGGNNGFTLIGYGAQLRTNPAQFRTALRITRPTYVGTRSEEARITLIEGLSFNAFQDANAQWGFDVTGVINLIIRNCTFTSGADGGTAPNVNYAAIRMRQTNTTDGDTGCFWIEIENCRFKGGGTGMPNALRLEGAINAVSITKNNFANVDTPIRFVGADTTVDTIAGATVGNGIKIIDNSFEGIIEGIKFNGRTTGTNRTRIVGLQIQNNRIESVNALGAFFQYSGLNLDSEAPPILGPNYLSSGEWGRYILNTNALTIDVRDEYVGRATINPASLAAGATTTIGSITLPPSTVGDQVKIEANGDLQGLIATGYVSAANTVTIRLANPTSGAVDLPSMNFIARVRPQY